MKRYGNLFDKTFTIDNLYNAYLDARTGKRSKRACFEFEKNLGENIYNLHRDINNGTYEIDSYFKFIIYEPKRREIHAPSFKDIVVQHAIYRIIYDIFDRSFINTSFACRIGYGTHRASKYTRDCMRKCNGNDYSLKLDIKKFFYSIDRKILRKLIEKKIKDKRLVDMMMLFANLETSTGIPIGNLLSQLFALIYLNTLDHFIKRDLKIRYYVRYVDDFLLIGLTRDECLDLRKIIIEFIKKKLNLELSKSTIQKIKKGVNFCGYRTWRTLIFIRKYSLYRFKNFVKKGKYESMVSLLGHAKRTNSLKYMFRIIKEASYDKDIWLPKGYRSIYNLLHTGT
jgi:retron-type reverse transcriptase